MGKGRMGIWGFAALMSSGCGGGSSELKQAQTTAYDTKLATVWNSTVEALKEDYPIVQVLDKDAHRIVTCWRVVDKAANSPGAAWRLSRIIVEISPDAPYRIAVSGRAAEYSSPVIRPIADGDVSDPGWREGRTERVILDIHQKLKQYATVTPTATPPASNPDAQENQTAACIIHPELMGVETRGMRGIAIGERGAMLLSD
jgi:hypothetical protein